MKVVKLYPGKWPRWLRITMRVLVIFILFIALLLGIIQSNPGQRFITSKVQSFLETKLNTRVELGRIKLSGFNHVSIKGLTVFDQEEKILVHSDSLDVHFALLPLLSNNVVVHSIHWKYLLGNVYTLSNQQLNYQFLLDAFASPADEKSVQDTSSASWNISLGRLALEKIRLMYKDEKAGMHTVINLDNLSWRFRSTSLADGKFDFNDLRISGLTGFYEQLNRPDKTPEPVETNSNQIPLLFKGKLVQLENIHFSYADEASGMYTGWQLESGSIQLLNAAITASNYQAGAIAMDGPKGFIINRRPAVISIDTSTASAPVTVQVKQLNLENGSFGMQNLEAAKSKYASAIDFNYLGVDQLNTSISDISWKDNQLAAALKSLQVYEKSGFKLKKASGNIAYGNDRLSFTNYYLETGNSQLGNNLELSMPKDANGSVITSQIGLKAALPSTRLTLSEALYFAPELKADPNFSKLWNKVIRLSGKLDGTLADLMVNQFQFQDNVGNDIQLNGRLRNLTDSKNIRADLSRIYIKTGKAAANAWLPPNTLPPNIQLADNILLQGSIAGGMQGIQTRLNLNSSYGTLRANGYIYDPSNKKAARYQLVLDDINMDVGKWISDTSIGLIQASGKVTGKGYDPSTMDAVAALKIRQANAMNYAYQNIDVDGTIKQNQYTALVTSKDTNLLASIDLSGQLNDGNPTIKGAIQLDRVDLMAIGLSTSPMLVKGIFDIDLLNTRPRSLEGSVLIHQVQYANATDLLQLDSISLMAELQNSEQYITLTGPFGDASLIGNYDYRQLAKATSTILNQQLNPTDSNRLVLTDSIGSQVAKLDASFVIPRGLEKMLPDIELRKPVVMSGRLNTDSTLLYLSIKQPQFRYGAAIIDSTNVLVYMAEDSLLAAVSVAAVDHPSLPIYKTALTASGKKGAIDWMLAVDDAATKPSYRIGGNLALESVQNWELNLAPTLLLNKVEFTTSEDNAVLFKNGKLFDAALEISSNNQSIQVEHTQPDSAQTPFYIVTIKDFQASTLSAFVSKDTSLAEGIINANLKFASSASDSSITGFVSVDSLLLFGKPVGTIKADLVKDGAAVGVTASVTGFGNNVNLKGTYAETLEANLVFDSLQLASIEPFTSGSLKQVSGALTGTLSVEGEASNPTITGTVQFHKGKATVGYLNNPLLIDGQQLTFEPQAVVFNQFTLQDTAGGKATIDGRVAIEDYLNPGFDLGVNAENFMVLGPKESEDQLLWGPARINSTIKVGGDLMLPKVNLQLKVMDNSVIGFVVPEDEPGIVNREGVIVFVDRNNPVDSSLLVRTKPAPSTAFEGLKGIEFSGDIELTPATTATIVIDPYNGDFLEVKGSTNLHLAIGQGNELTISGIYEIEEGKYEMSLSQLIKRSFNIEKGSTLTWNGDPLEADIKISARNLVNAPAIDLIRDQSGGSRSDLTMYRQKVPVYVYLDITGQIMEPSIAFRLDMPEKERNLFNGAVYTRLKQINTNESELTKQVMALLVLQTFVSENPLASLENRSSGGIGFTAKQSVSKILSQQLNTLAGSLINGIDLNFDLQTNEDYRSGSREESTVLNVGASKSLFNDRLTVSIGSNIGLLGETPANGAHLIGDVLIDYKLSRDGRYRIRAYQRNQTDAILLGQIIETGVSFLIVMDFNQFREIFEKNKQQQQQSKDEK